MKKKNHLFLCLCLFVDYRGKKVLGTQVCQTRVPYKGLKLGKLEYHKRRKKRALHLSFVFTKNLSLVSSSIVNLSLQNSSSMWHFFNKKIHINTSFFFFL